MSLTEQQKNDINALKETDPVSQIISIVYEPVQDIINSAARKYKGRITPAQQEAMEFSLLEEFIHKKVWKKFNGKKKRHDGKNARLLDIIYPIARSIVYDGLFRKGEPVIADIPEYTDFLVNCNLDVSDELYQYLEKIKAAVVRWMRTAGAPMEAAMFAHKAECGKNSEDEKKDSFLKIHNIDKKKYTMICSNMRVMVRKFHICGKSIRELLKERNTLPEKCYNQVRFAFCRLNEIPLIDALDMLSKEFKNAGYTDIRSAYKDIVNAANTQKLGVLIKLRKDNRFTYMEKVTFKQIKQILETKTALKEIKCMQDELKELKLLEQPELTVLKDTVKKKKKRRKGTCPETGLVLGTMKYLSYDCWRQGISQEKALETIRQKNGQKSGNINTVNSWFRSFENGQQFKRKKDA